MNFFKSVFSDDHPEISTSNQQPEDHQTNPIRESSTSDLIPNPTPSISAITTVWSFGGLVKTLASKSESVIETYRRDLQEFGTGLRKETDVIREVAGRAVRDLPASLEASAAAAQESLESVGQAIDVLGNTVTEIISHGSKDSIPSDYNNSDGEDSDSQQNLNAKPYSRLDIQIRTIQSDFNTYSEDPEELDEFQGWKLGFLLDKNSGEIQTLLQENTAIEDIYKEIVPSKIDGETFWSRYYFRVYKLRKTEEARAKLVKKAISGEEEEDLSWEVDDEAMSERKTVNADVSVASNQPLLTEEEDLSWDEIEDIDETKATTSEIPDKADLKKRLSAMEEEEDLSWDIEDDDEPLVKPGR